MWTLYELYVLWSFNLSCSHLSPQLWSNLDTNHPQYWCEPAGWQPLKGAEQGCTFLILLALENYPYLTPLTALWKAPFLEFDFIWPTQSSQCVNNTTTGCLPKKKKKKLTSQLPEALKPVGANKRMTKKQTNNLKGKTGNKMSKRRPEKLQCMSRNLEGHEHVCESSEKGLMAHLWLTLKLCTRRKTDL